MRALSGEKAMSKAPPKPPALSVLTSAPVLAFQMRITLAWSPAATSWPLGDQSTENTSLLAGVSCFTMAPVVASRISTADWPLPNTTSPPMITLVPSGEKATSCTPPRATASVRTNEPSALFQILTVSSVKLEVTSSVPSDDTSMALMSYCPPPTHCSGGAPSCADTAAAASANTQVDTTKWNGRANMMLILEGKSGHVRDRGQQSDTQSVARGAQPHIRHRSPHCPLRHHAVSDEWQTIPSRQSRGRRSPRRPAPRR